MSVAARFDLKMDPDEKAVVAKAAALMGTTMAGSSSSPSSTQNPCLEIWVTSTSKVTAPGIFDLREVRSDNGLTCRTWVGDNAERPCVSHDCRECF